MQSGIAMLVLLLSWTAGGARPDLQSASQQTGAQAAAAVIEAARSGNAQQAWVLWNRLPAGPEKLRVGIQLSAETLQVARGLDLYDQLTDNGQRPDETSLGRLALATAIDLLNTAGDSEVKANACGSALVLQASLQRCIEALEGMADPAVDAPLRTAAIAALANAGVPTYAQTLTQLPLAWGTRLRLAQHLTRLPSAERLALVRPLLSESDVALRYQALQVLADIPDQAVVGVLRSVRPEGPLNMVLTVALARHGDSASLTALGSMLPHMDGYLKIQAARAMVTAGDVQGGQILNAALSGPVDIDRVYAAQALLATNPAAARRALLQSLASGSAAIRPAVLDIAGAAGLGTDRLVYRKMAEGALTDRAVALAAVVDTLAPAGRR